MEIKRCTKSFRSGVRGAAVGDLLPATHELVRKFPGLFEDVADFVARKFPEHAAKAEAPAPAPKKAPAKRAAAKPKEG